MKKKLLFIAIFIAYCAILIVVMVFRYVPTIRIGQLMLNFGGTESGHPANFIPFTTIVPYLLGYKGWIIAGVNIFGNIIPLIPIGFILPFALRMTWKRTAAVAIFFPLAIETLQAVLHKGIFDIDDVILNACGVLFGYGTLLILSKWMREKKFIHITATGAIILCLAAGAVYYIYPKDQLTIPEDDRFGASAKLQGDTAALKSDLCGGTGGTGVIVTNGINTVTIRRQDGVEETLTLTAHTDIRDNTGPIAASDLRIGEHVTIVTYTEEIASTILVCS